MVEHKLVNRIAARPWNKSLLWTIGAGVLALLLARVRILGGIAPLGPAFQGAAWLMGVHPAVLLAGSLIGLLLDGVGWSIGWMQIIPSLIVGVSGLVFWQIKIQPKRWMVAIMITAGTLLAAVLANNLIFEWLMSLVSLITALLMLQVYYCMLNLVQNHSRELLTGEEIVSIALSCGTLILSMFNIQLAGFSIGNVLTYFSVMAMALCAGAGGGAAAGLALGMVLALGNGATAIVIGNLGMCGLLAGLFARLKRPGVAAGFIIANALATLYINGSSEVILSFPESLCASVLLFALPKKWLQWLEQMVSGTCEKRQNENYVKRIQELAVRKLHQVSSVFGRMHEILDGSYDLPEAGCDGHELLDSLANQVCAGCLLRSRCWKDDLAQTCGWVQQLLECRINPSVECPRKDRVMAAGQQWLEAQRQQKTAREKFVESRQAAARQLQEMCRVVTHLAGEMDQTVQFLPDIERDIRSGMDRIGVRVRSVVAEKIGGRLEIIVERKSCHGGQKCAQDAQQVISQACDQKMALCQQSCTGWGGGWCVNRYEPAPQYELITGVDSRNAPGEQTCGDTFTCHGLPGGKMFMALADGMGNGAMASEQSGATIQLLEEFYHAQYPPELIFDSLNQLMMLRSGQEIFTTLDLCVVDLVEGKSEFIKVGAISSFLLRDGHVHRIGGACLPLGIIDTVHPARDICPLLDGDFIIMATDGVCAEHSDEWMLHNLERLASRNPQKMARELLDRALADGARDDITVMVSRVKKAG